MIDEIQLEKFYLLSLSIPVIDVRAPVEYGHGHIPGSVNVPLFNDEERAHIGLIYKNNGEKEAIDLVRERRKGAIETKAQEDFIAAYRVVN